MRFELVFAAIKMHRNFSLGFREQSIQTGLILEGGLLLINDVNLLQFVVLRHALSFEIFDSQVWVNKQPDMTLAWELQLDAGVIHQEVGFDCACREVRMPVGH